MEFKIYSNMYIVQDTSKAKYELNNLILINEKLELTDWLPIKETLAELYHLIGLYLHDDNTKILTKEDIDIPNMKQYLTILLNKTDEQTLIMGFFIEMRKILRNNHELFTLFDKKQYNITKYSFNNEDKI